MRIYKSGKKTLKTHNPIHSIEFSLKHSSKSSLKSLKLLHLQLLSILSIGMIKQMKNHPSIHRENGVHYYTNFNNFFKNNQAPKLHQFQNLSTNLAPIFLNACICFSFQFECKFVNCMHRHFCQLHALPMTFQHI